MEARPLLLPMLNSEHADIRLNALEVLLADGREHLEPTRQKFIELTLDSDQRVRMISFQILFKVKDVTAENALLAALARAETTGQSGESNDKEICAAVQALCWSPVDAEKVISAVTPLIDEQRSSVAVVWNTMQSSSGLGRSAITGGRLIARYWSVLSTTANESLPYIATGAMDDNDDRTLEYLRKFAEIANPKARGHAAGKLVRHTKFDPKREQVVMQQLLSDQSPWVRLQTIGNLCERKSGTDCSWLVQTAMNLARIDPDKAVVKNAVEGVFDALGNASREDRSLIWLDAKLNLANFMIQRLDNDDLRRLISASPAAGVDAQLENKIQQNGRESNQALD